VARPTVTEITVGRACRALLLENDWLSTTVLLDQGADIHTLVYKPTGVDVLWKPPRPPREPGIGPTPAGDSFAVWTAHYRGGWQIIFPNFGPAVEYKGAPLDFHGEAARTVWQVEALEASEAQALVTLGVTLLKSPFRIQRRMSLKADQPLLSIHETITNDGPEAMDCMWGHHPAFGAPLVSPDSFIDSGARLIESDDDYRVIGNDLPLGQSWRWPMVANRRGEALDLSRLPAPGSGHSRVLFLKDFEESWYALTNPTLGFGVGMVWNGDLFPYACFWQETGGVRDYPFFGAAYVTAIEPNSSYPGHGLTAVMRETSTQLVLEPGQSRSLDLKAVLYSGSQRVTRIDPQGTVWRHG
jgi:galactose mutarotase-like enzyme